MWATTENIQFKINFTKACYTEEQFLRLFKKLFKRVFKVVYIGDTGNKAMLYTERLVVGDMQMLNLNIMKDYDGVELTRTEVA